MEKVKNAQAEGPEEGRSVELKTPTSATMSTQGSLKSDLYLMDDALADLHADSSRFRVIHMFFCGLLFNASQFFYSIPIYQLYPTYKCWSKDGA